MWPDTGNNALLISSKALLNASIYPETFKC